MALQINAMPSSPSPDLIIPLDMGDSKVLFGYIIHKGEKIDESVQELIDFLMTRLHKS